MDILYYFDEKNFGDNIVIDNLYIGVMMNCVWKVLLMLEENGRKYDNFIVEEVLYYLILMFKVGGFYFENFWWIKLVLVRIFFDVLVMVMVFVIVIRIIVGFMINGDFLDKLMGWIVFVVVNISNIVMYFVLIINIMWNLLWVFVKFLVF